MIGFRNVIEPRGAKGINNHLLRQYTALRTI